MLAVDWNMVGVVVALAFCGLLVALMLRKPLGAALAHVKALPRPVQVVTAILVIVATVQAQKSGNGGGTNEPPSGLNGGAGFLRSCPNAPTPTVTAEEIARGYRLDYETNDVAHVCAMPADGVYVGNSHIHGASSSWGMNLIDFGDWSFPFGSNHAAYSKFWWFVDGRIRVSPLDPTGEIATGARDVLSMQGTSRIWRAAVGDGQSIAWENVFVGGGTNSVADLQIVLRGNGDFETWSNKVGRVYARINPDDWDGDGLDNAIDEWPMANDGDCFGTGVDWLNANCSGVLSASAGTNGEIVVEWGTNANANAYYWLQFSVFENGTRVTVDCDGPSNLGDMAVIANSNQVCRVPLLIGAEYRVRTSRPVADIYASDLGANVWLNDAQPSGMRGTQATGSSCDFGVERPVSFSFGGGGNGYLTAQPDVGAVIGSVTGNCCEVSFYTNAYTWTCSSDCHCAGYEQWWTVTAQWEGYTRLFPWWMQCGCQRANETNSEAWVSLAATPVVMRGGWMGCVSAEFAPPESAGGATATLRVEGGERVALWQSTNRAESVSLPMTLAGGQSTSFFFEGLSSSESVGDVRFCLDVVNDGVTSTISSAVTIARVDRLDMACAVAGQSPNPPPFEGETDCPFSVTNSLSPDRHLVVPFENVATLGTNGLSVAGFAVDMGLVLAPQGVSSSGLSAEWEVVEAHPQMSGSLVPCSGLAARFVNPTQGGVYRFRARCGGSPWTEGNVVLPLSGASVDAVLESDFSVYRTVMTNLAATSGPLERQTPSFGLRWFSNNGAADYRGRVDNATWQTVWRYNQVDDFSGFGAVATVYGIPARMSKLGNFLAGYGTRILGVWGVSRWLAQSIGTDNDESADMSWDAGTDVADGSNFMARVSALSTNMWSVGGAKVRTLWPNPAWTDNHVVAPTNSVDYNFFFRSPRVVERAIR